MFAECGFEATTIDQITAEAGVSERPGKFVLASRKEDGSSDGGAAVSVPMAMQVSVVTCGSGPGRPPVLMSMRVIVSFSIM